MCFIDGDKVQNKTTLLIFLNSEKKKVFLFVHNNIYV